MTQAAKKIQFYLFLFLIFILPLSSYDRFLIRPVVIPATALWVLSSILLIVFIVAGKNGIKWHGGLVLIFLFTIYEVARDLTSTSIVRSLFGDARGPFLSVLTTISLFIVYITAVQFSSDTSAKKKIFLTMAVSISIVSIISILQHFTELPFLNPSLKTYATLQTISEVAGICLLMIGVVGGLIYIQHNKLVYYLSIPLFSFAIIATGNKAAIFLQAVFILYVAFRFFLLKKSKLVIFFLLIIMGNLIIYYMPINVDYVKVSRTKRTVNSGSQSAKIKGIQPKEMVISMDKFESSFASRVKIWRLAKKMWLEKPFVGWGQADFPNVYTKFKMLNYKENIKIITADTHNWVNDTLVKGGIIKLFILMFTMFYFIRNSAFKSRLNNYLLLTIGIYFIYLLFNPSYLVNKVYLFTLLGLISINFKRDSSSRLPAELRVTERRRHYLFIIAILISAAFFMFNTYFGYLRLNAEIIGTKGVRSVLDGDETRGIYYSEKATGIFPHEPDYWQRLGWAYMTRYGKTKSADDLKHALGSYKKALSLVPNDINVKYRIYNLSKQL